MSHKKDPFLIIDQKICKVSKNIFHTAWLKPVNLEQEQEKFFKIKDYNPTFHYKPFKSRPLEKSLNSLEIPSGYPLTKLFQEIKFFLASYLQSLKNRETKNFTNASLFNKPSSSLVRYAQSTLEKPIRKSKEKKAYPASYLKDKFTKLLADLGVKEWTIQIRPRMITRMTVNHQRKIISMKEEGRFSSRDIKKLQAHEIETHLLRGFNGSLQPYEIFATEAIPGYLPTEEGLALYNEEKARVLSPEWSKIYAGRVIAVNKALSFSFGDIYNYLLQFFSPQEAFQLTLRAKRGLGDTSQPGGFIKDHVYLQGKLLIEDYIKKGGKIKPLYAGKIGIQHLYLLEKGILKPPKYLPKYLR